MINYPVVTGFLKILFPGIDVILRDQNVGSPDLPYVTWFEIVNVSKSRPEEEYVTRDYPLLTLSGEKITTLGGEDIDVIRPTLKLTQNKVSTIQIDIYNETISQAVIKNIANYIQAGELGDSAIVRASAFSSQLYQRQNNIGVMDWIDPSRFSQFLGDNSESRAMMELKLNNTQIHEELAATIDTNTIDINLTLQR